MTDTVVWLRSLAAMGTSTAQEAADEIEQLRAENEQLRDRIEALEAAR